MNFRCKFLPQAFALEPFAGAGDQSFGMLLYVAA